MSEVAGIACLPTRLTQASCGMIDAQGMARIKPHMRLVDTVREPLVDKAELCAALGQGRCAGAARKVLTDGAAHSPIVTVGSGKDRDQYRRWLAVCCRDDGLEPNAELVRLGWALAYRPGNDSFPRPE